MDLLVGCDDDVERGSEIGGLEAGGRADRSGKGAFHVAGTATVELVVGLVGVVGIAVPAVGGIGGYVVVVAHQGQPTLSGAQLADDGELGHARRMPADTLCPLLSVASHSTTRSAPGAGVWQRGSGQIALPR